MSRRVYVGVMTEVPSGTVTKNLSVANLNDFFTVSNGSTTWTLSDSTAGKIGLVPGNIGVPNSTASITLTAKQDLTNVVISGQYYTESNYDKINLTVAGAKKITDGSGNSSLSNRYTGSLSAGKSIILKYSKDDSTDASNEANTKFYIACDSIQAPSGETELKSVARRVKKIYVGVNGIARKVKRAYAGVANLARQFFGGYDAIEKVEDPIRFIQTPYDDSVDNSYLQGVSALNLANKYALFAGSQTMIYESSAWQYYPSKYVYAVDKDLIVTSAANLLKYSSWLKNASLNNYVVLGGGYSKSASSPDTSSPTYKNSPYVYAYGQDLTRHDLDELTDTSSNEGHTAGNGQYAIFPRWSTMYSLTDSDGNPTDKIITYNNNLIQSTFPTDGTLEGRIGSSGACRFRDYAVFFGTTSAASSSAVPTKSVYAYDQNLNKITLPNLAAARSRTYTGKCVANNNYVAFAGGRTTSDGNNYIYPLDVYDKNLIKVSDSPRLSYKTEWLGAVGIDNWMVFCGGHYGYTNTGQSTNVIATDVNIFDENLIRTNDTLENGLRDLEGASVGDYGILVGYGSQYNTIIFQGV